MSTNNGLNKCSIFCGAALASAIQFAYASPRHERYVSQASVAAIMSKQAEEVLSSEIIFVDSRVPDYQMLIRAARNAQVVIVDSSRDGVQQIADALAGRGNLKAIHIVSHGNAGTLLLGNGPLFEGNIANYSEQLQTIGKALTADGDILLYGCEVGAGNEGQAFLSQLSAATGADIAASVDNTGGLAKGGDWHLEITTGDVSQSYVLDTSSLSEYDNVLVTTSVNSVAGLKAAITTGNTDGVDDVITLTGNITFASAADAITINVSDGQTMSIVGGGFTLSGNNLARVLDVSTSGGSDVTISDLTISNGFLTGAGGNTPGNGAGLAGGDALGANIRNSGTLTITGSTITAGKAAGGGGGGGGAADGGGAGGGGGGFGSTFGGTGGTNNGGATHSPGAASAGTGGDGAGFGNLVGRGGTTSGGAGANYGSGYTNGGIGGTANNGSISIGGGGGGGGYHYAGGRGGNAAGGIYNTGILTITTSSITNNIAAGGGGGGGGASGISGNGGDAGSGIGAIWNAGGTVQIDSTTNTSLATGNVGAAGGVGITNNGGSSNGAAGTATSQIRTTGGGTTDTNYNPNSNPTTSNLSGDSVAWAGVGNTVSLDASGNANLADAELDVLNSGNGNWADATLTIQRSGTAITSDTFGFNTSGALFTVSGSNLQAGGLTFATFTNTNGVLTITFTSSGTTATSALVDNVAQRITYRSDTPAGDATISYVLTDGDGGTATTANVTVTSDTIYVTNTTDTATVNVSNGVSFSEAVAIAAADATGSQTLIFSSGFAGQTATLAGNLAISESLTINADSASAVFISGSTITLGGGTTLSFTNGSGDTATISSTIAGTGGLTKSDAGTLTLSPTSNNGGWSGAMSVTGGTLTAGTGSNPVSTLSSGTLTLDGSTLAMTITGVGSITTLANNVVLGASGGTFDITGGGGANTANFSGAVSGGNLTKSGASILQLSGTNTYTGTTTVSAGTLSVASDGNLGSDTVTLAAGSTLAITGAANIDNAIALSGDATVSNSANATLSGIISGGNNLTKIGASTLTLSGNNTYTGTTVSAGALSIGSDANLGSGAMTLASGSSLLLTGTTNVDNNIALTGNVTFTISADATLSGVISGGFSIAKNGASTLTLSGNNTYTGSTTISGGALSIAGDSNLGGNAVAMGAGTTLAITGSGTIDNNLILAGAATLQAASAVTWSGVISGATTLAKTGAGTLTLSGTNTHSGTTTVSAGTLLISGSTDSATTVASGGTLAGGGTIDGAVTVQNGGTLSPGSSPGTLTINGDLTLNSGSTLAVEINGTTAGTGYDQIIVTGAVDVTGATLSATHGYVPGIGDSYTIFNNDLADAITGTFSGLAQGGTLAAAGNGTVLTASYVGGTGNDFTLTAPSNTPPVVANVNGDSRSFTQGAGPIFLDGPNGAPDATVTDGDSTDFNNGALVVSIVTNEVAGEDVLGILNQGTGSGQIGVSGADVTYEGVIIGQYAGGTNGDDLVIDLNGSADVTAAQALVRNLTYANNNATNNINQTARTLRVTLSDGDGGTSSNADVTVAVVETVAPSVVSIVVADTALAVGETTTVTITFSEAVTGLTTGDFTVANGVLSGLSSADGGITWTATLTPSATTQDATNLITLDNTAYTDIAGNAGTGTSDSNNYAIDTLRPTATLVVADTALSIGETSTLTITFNEAVTGFTNADLTIANGTLSAVSSSDGGVTWTATFTPTAGITDATNLITLDNTGVTDAAGNSGSGSTDSNNYAIDSTRPTASVVVADTSLRVGETSLVTVTFSEAVTGFTNVDLTIANGTLSTVSSSDGGVTWTTTLTPSASVEDASNVITLDNTGVVDAAGNSGSGTADSNNYAIDTLRPTATIVVADTALAVGETSGVTITFSEAVSGFTNADLTLANGTLSSVSSSDGGITWTATFTPSSGVEDATNVITLDNTGVTDAAGNTGTGTTDSNNYAIDTSRPTASIVVADTALAIGETSLVTVTFSEAVTGFTNADLTVANGTLSALSSSDGGVTWTATFTPTADITDATNVITLDNTGVTDAAGNAGTGTTDSNNYAIDSTRPTASIVVADTSLIAGETSLVTITFSEAVTGFTNADLTVANGTLTSVSSSDGGITWTATLTPSAGVEDAANVITLDNTGVLDAAGNSGVGTTDSNNYAIDTLRPSATLVVADTALAVGETSLVTITFNEAITGFTNADLTVANGTLGTVSSSDGGTTWTATLTPTAGIEDPANLITLDNTGVVDAAGNAGSGSTDSNNYAIDTLRPTASLVVTDTALIGGETTTLTMTFSEAVSGLTTADLVAANASLSSLSTGDGGITWTATLTPDASVEDATNLVTLDNTGITDAAGNTGTGTTDSNNYAVDSTAPTITSVSVPANATYVASDVLSFTLNTSEAITVDTAGGTPQLALTIGATSRNAAYVSGSSTSALVFSYTVQAGDNDSDGIAVGALSANGGILRDAAGNNMTLTLNSVGSTAAVLVDTTAPALQSLSPADEAVDVLPSANLVITLSENIALGTGNLVIFDSNDTPVTLIDVTNHAGQLSISGGALTINPSADLVEQVSYYVQIASGAITDVPGNPYAGITNDTTWNFTVTDISPPVVATITPDGTPAAGDASVDFLVVFDETASAITTDDFTLTGTGTAAGTIASVSAASGSSVTVTVSSITGTGTLRLDLLANTDIVDGEGNGNNTNGYVAAFTGGTAHTVDRDAPAAPATPDLAVGSDSGESSTDNITNDTTPTITGTAEANATVTVSSSVDGSLGTTTADGSGNWSFTPGTALTVGTHFVSAIATDAAGNLSASSASLTVQIDNTAPAGHSVGFGAGFYNAGNVASGSFAFAGAEVGVDYSYSISSSGGGTPVTGSGTFATATDQVTGLNLSGLGDGTLTLSVIATDTAGNAATAVTANAIKDIVLPTGHSVSFNDTTLNAAEAGSTGFTFAGAEVGAAYSYSITSSGGGTAVTGSGNFATATDAVTGVNLSGLGDGTLTLSVVVTDTSGNAAPAVTANASLDQAAPSVTLSSAASATLNSTFSTTIAFSETVSNFVVGDIAVTNATLSGFTDNGGGSYSVTVTPTADGAVTLNVAASVAQDAAGNNNTAATQLSRTYDGTAPTLSSSSPADGASNVAGDADLVLTFSEPVAAGSGNLTLFDAADNSVVEAFAVGSVTINSNVLTLNPASTLTPTHSYYLQIANTALVDAAGNAYAGINDATTLNFTVTNVAPVANGDTGIVAEDAAVSLTVLTNDTDADSAFNLASVTVVTAPQHGSTSVNTGTGVITYTPAANYNGPDSFTYTVEDVYSSLSNVATVSITVTPVNDAPVAVADSTSTPEDNAVSIDVAGNDTDIDTSDSVDPDSIVIVSAPASGAASVVDGEVLYTPNPNFNGSDSFTYTIDDQNGATSNLATVLINVTGVNDLPSAVADSATVDEDGTVDIDVLANDSDADGSLVATSVSILAAASNGSTSVDALTGEITYTPATNFNGTDSFSYTVQDNSGGSATATVTVTVTSINDAPVANADNATLQEDLAHSINVLGNDTDLDGTLVPASVQVVTAAEEGITSVNTLTGAIVYTPAGNFNGSDSFTYRVQDNQGAWSAPATVTVTVQDLNDEPLANADTATTPEDTAVTINLLTNDSDVDGTLDASSLVLLTQPANGSLTDNGDGTVLYTPVANFFGSNSFTYTVADNDGGVSNIATVTVTVNPVNDAPVISGTPAVTVAEDSAYSFTPTASDVDNTTLTFSVTNLPVWASFNTSTGALTGTPENDHVGTHSGIVISVSDGSLTASLPAFAINVSNTNDAPVISGTPPASINQGGSYNFTPTVVDVDAGTNLVFSINNLPPWASFDTATGAFSGTPGNSHVGTYNDIVISVSDGVTTTPLTSFSVTVANVNDAPVIAADSYSLNEGSLLNPNAANGVLANDVDIDGDTLTATLVTAPRNASQFSLNGDGSFNYLHSGDETRIDSFTYRISDGAVTSEPVTVNLSITAVNDAPSFVTSPVLAMLEGTAYNYEVGATDPDSVVTLSLMEGAPAWLSLSGGRLFGTAPLNQTGVFTIVLRATDGQYTVDQTYNLTVAEQEATLVSITTAWQGLPSIVGNTVDLIVTLTHNKGPALSGASLAVGLRDVDTVSSMSNCGAGTNAFTCPVNLATNASISFRLRLTPEEEGNLIVNLNLTQAAEQVAATITDVSVTERAVSQGDVTFNIANATALASINLLNDGTRELVAGTALGDTVKLLNYTIASGTAQVIGEIENRGHTDRVRVADIDQDGLEDMVVVNRSGDASAVYYDRGDSFEVEPASVPLAHAREALVRDLNDDGFPELVLGAGGFNLYIYENNEGVYDLPPLVFTSPASIVHFALMRRLPADAPFEGTLVISSSSAVQLVRFGLNPDGGAAKPDAGQGLGGEAISEKFSLLQELPLAGVSSLQLVDVDGDGREEIVASTTHQGNSSEASGVTVIAVTEDEELLEVARLGAASAKHVAVADFNGDGLPDLLVANDNNSYQFYRGTGSLTSWNLTNTILYHSSTLVIPEDVNGDGLADVLVYEDGDEQVELYLSAPDGDTGETADLVVSASVAPVRQDRYHFNYTLNLANQGEFIAENVRINLPLPEGVDIVTLPDNCTHDEEVDEVNCTLTSLEAAAEQTLVLTLEGDGRINSLSLTAHATSDALEVETANNSATTSLSGMFQYKRARIKGGGGSLDYLWLSGLLGLALGRRRLQAAHKSENLSAAPRGRPNSSPVPPLSKARRNLLLSLPAALLLTQPGQELQAEVPAKNSYLEGTFATITSDWDTLNFFYDLAGNTQEGALVEKDDQRFGWQLLYGFRAHRNLALELGYIDTGETELEVDAIISDTDSLRQLLADNAPISGDGPYVGLRASHFADEGQELYFKAGIWSWSAGYTLTIGDQHEWVTRDGTDWLLGLGFAIPVNPRLKIGGALQSTSLGDERLMLVGINLAYSFDVGF